MILQEPELSSVPDLYEIVDGQIQEKPVGVQQATFATDLIGFLWPYVRAQRLGRVVGENLFQLIPGAPHRRPDLAFVSVDRWPLSRTIPAQSAWEIVPDLMVEVISPTNRFVEVTAKLQEYFTAGVRQVWLVDLETFHLMIYSSMTQVTILDRNATLENNPLFPGFRLPMIDLFSCYFPS
jgi:Uma2 family endonuclease